jgi:flavin reductase (DIM6/NTAB) family NADH-FMN oxidoreductase RutF
MDLSKFNLAPFHVIDQEWALLTAGDKNKFNTMTISWGGMGTLWNKPVVTVYVRPIRYTYQFMEANEYFTVSFYDAKYKSDLGILGAKSGKDCDKIALTKLTPQVLKNGVSFKQANLTLVCRKIYFQDFDIKNIPETEQKKFYVKESPHRMYIGEVVEIVGSKPVR